MILASERPNAHVRGFFDDSSFLQDANSLAEDPREYKLVVPKECFFSAQVESEDVVFTLETIVEKFGEEMAPFAVGLCQHLTQAFWRLQVTLSKAITIPARPTLAGSNIPHIIPVF